MKTACALVLVLSGVLVAADSPPEKASPAVVDYVQSKIVPLGTDPVIVAAVKAENARRKSLDEIKELDEKWKRTPGVADYMKALMESDCGKHLRSLQSAAGFYAEAFVMDNQGANVCMTDKTSDYWQGDEAKFQRSYKGGAGAVFIDDVAFDESSQKYVVQASVPVKDGEAVIGSLTVSLDMDAFESR
jgi:hypothetical protein